MDNGTNYAKAPTAIFWIFGIKSSILVFAPIEDASLDTMALLKVFALICALSSFVSIFLMKNQKIVVRFISCIPFVSIILLLLSLAIVGGESVPMGLAVVGVIVISIFGFTTLAKVQKYVQRIEIEEI